MRTQIMVVVAALSLRAGVAVTQSTERLEMRRQADRAQFGPLGQLGEFGQLAELGQLAGLGQLASLAQLAGLGELAELAQLADLGDDGSIDFVLRDDDRALRSLPPAPWLPPGPRTPPSRPRRAS
jgi:hypothetical protein